MISEERKKGLREEFDLPENASNEAMFWTVMERLSDLYRTIEDIERRLRNSDN